MDEAAFEQKLNELADEIDSVPESHRAKFIALVKQTGNCHKQLRKSVNGLQESLDYLRVSVKYLLFDLESTRRENASLKKLLEDNNK
ncbi:MAG: transcriptional regulator [Planctomycetota bacterium]|nr:MAG: transcriptional regulator [Planctomycetota bacterium]